MGKMARKAARKQPESKQTESRENNLCTQQRTTTAAQYIYIYIYCAAVVVRCCVQRLFSLDSVCLLSGCFLAAFLAIFPIWGVFFFVSVLRLTSIVCERE
eukprot:m.53601 g.53601  ORF g.53601 m.53601 type:complete len:100 (+) comp12811_c0_seq2:1406-1705(+)